ncbi:MAG TPA: carboxypeptidase regulatory-like domain-containing protein [Xanthobacteraceae bacterium]|nr:carboxypeptidase regulatory-like domain-containing protein [Xanthobacteraceae bacterium]
MSLRNVSRNLALGAAGILLIATQPLRAADDRGAVQGVVTNAAGQGVTGAMVKLKNADKRLTFMVISQDGGRYEAKDLPVGKYTVQGVGGMFQSDVSAPVTVTVGQSARADVALKDARGPLLPPAWPQRIPEAQADKTSKDFNDLPAGENKMLVAQTCTPCHDVQRIMVKRSSEDEWSHIVARMRTRMAAANQPVVNDEDTKKIVAYLSSNFKPIQPYDGNSRLPTDLLQGKALKYRAVTYDLADHFAEPHDVAADPQGNAWVGERAGRVGRFDPRTLEFTEIRTPPGPAAEDRQSLGNPQIDAHGIMWVPDGPNNRWLSFDTKTEKFVAYAWPRNMAGGAGGNSMALHPDGTIWATGANKEVRMLDPQSATFKAFPSPSAKASPAPGAYGLAVAGDGSVWWAEDEADKMARVDPATGKVEEFKIPDVGGHAFPRRMNTDANGDLWVALWDAGKLMKIDYKTKEMTVYTPPSKTGGNYSVVVDKKNNYIWVSEHQVDKIARFDPKTQEWVEFPLPDAESDPRRIDIDPTNSNRIFFSGNIAGRVGFIEILQ